MEEFDDVILLTSVPAEVIAASRLAPGEGLRAGDGGTIVDTYHAPNVYTVEFFRNGKFVGVADVKPEQIRAVTPSAVSVAVQATDD